MRQAPWGAGFHTLWLRVPIIISPTGLHLVFGILQGKEPVVVQPFLSKLSVESFDRGVARGFSRPAEIQLHPLQICKLVQALGDKSGTVISRMVWERLVPPNQLVENIPDSRVPDAGRLLGRENQARSRLASRVNRLCVLFLVRAEYIV